MAAPQGAQEGCAVKGWLIQGWSGSFRWLGERFEIASASKRFVVIFSIARNRTLSTTAFQRKINGKSRKKLQKKKIRRVGKRGRKAASDGGFPHRGWSRGAGLMPFARRIAAGVAPLGQRVRGVFRLPPLSLWTPLSPQRERGCSPLSDPKGVGSSRKY